MALRKDANADDETGRKVAEQAEMILASPMDRGRVIGCLFRICELLGKASL